jgi:hypothetical protein
MTAILAAIVGGFVGSLLTLVGEIALRALRQRGEVRCEVRGWRVVPLIPDGPSGYRFPGPSEKVPGHVGPAHCYFRVYFFNEKDVDTALLDLGVMFRWKGGATTSVPVLEGTSEQLMFSEVPVLDLPSRRAVWSDMVTTITDEQGKRTSEAERMELRGYFPDGELFQKVIAGSGG